MTTFLGLIKFPRTAHRTKEIASLTITSFIIKNTTQKQPMEEVHKARHVGRGAELPRRLQVHHAPSTAVCSPAQKLSEPCCLGFLRRFYYIGMIN